jgi:hypothetical protein
MPLLGSGLCLFVMVQREESLEGNRAFHSWTSVIRVWIDCLTLKGKGKQRHRYTFAASWPIDSVTTEKQ